MKTKILIAAITSIMLASCSSMQQTTVNDDIYYSPKDELLSSKENYFGNQPYSSPNEVTLSKKFEKEISAVLDDTTRKDVDTLIYADNESENPYETIIVDSYDEAYQRRLDAMKSPYYGMNNYYNIYFSDSYWYASSFIGDPFYNVIIMGDQVWVEPYWISSGYYYWNRPYGYYYPYYYRSYYYDPFYYSYYHNPYYNPYYRPYYWGSNDNYASSSFHSFRQRTLASSSLAADRTRSGSRELPENYMGRNISRSSTVKSGIDRQTDRSERTRGVSTTRTSERLVTEGSRTRTGDRNVTRIANRPQETTELTRTVQQRPRTATTTTRTTTRSTYNTTKRAATRYTRPESTSVRTENNNRATTRTSTYSPTRSTNNRSGSTYSPNTSTRNSGNSSVRSSGNSRSNSSGSSVRSSGSSSTRSSGSSGSSGSSSSGSSSGSSSSSSGSRGRR